ncbi:MAG: hypothetical protein WDN03_09845 [Rhizomicrobium sp.]
MALLAVALAVPAPAAAGPSAAPRPRLLTGDQYRCLAQHLNDLAIGKRGNVVDLTVCPPAIMLGSFPVPPNRAYIFLTKDDIACLKQPGPNKAVIPQPNGMVALYLQPCGQ